MVVALFVVVAVAAAAAVAVVMVGDALHPWHFPLVLRSLRVGQYYLAVSLNFRWHYHYHLPELQHHHGGDFHPSVHAKHH